MLTTIVLTKNSEATIKKCLESVSFSDEILVIDDNSSDKTLQIVKEFKTKVITHSLEADFAKQRNFALSKAKYEWVLFIDSDEIVSDALRNEIVQAVKNPQKNEGFSIMRRDTMWGKELRHGENGLQYILRLGKKSNGKWEGKVHERWEIKGQTGKLNNLLHHFPHQTLAEFLSEINWYTTIRAQELYKKGVRVSWVDVLFYPKAKFVQNYLLKKGFLDGTIGLILAILMSFHSFLVRGKLWQLQKNK